MRENISKVYEPNEVEQKWYDFWEKENLFVAEPDENKKPFCIVIPPPNVTGQLHMGHAIDNTLQDILIRWRRMQGYSSLWMPGTDHAGIATQIKVEEALRQEQGISRYDLGREQFIEKVWEWKKTYGRRITNQLRRLGASCDWSKERFTMDEGCSKAVREVFVSLYEKGLIYRSRRITNWCINCHTALSDIEVEHEEKAGFLWYVKYSLADDENSFVTIATTRPETILGDTAVAVNPEDERYKHLIGKELIVPVVNRKIPIIADDYVDKSFGTGAVKVTPAHDPNDFDMGLRHNLEQLVVIDKSGMMTELAGDFAGMKRYECRKALVEKLQSLGIVEKIVEHTHAVGHCQRCNNVVEPLISLQWFVKMQPLVERPLKSVQDGDTSFIPPRFSKIYTNWLDNIRDWCISRQIWWGHRIPVWYCKECNKTFISREDLSTCPDCSGSIVQDEDVLDTWFSSALWPFSTLGWPEKTKYLDYYYPTSVLVTGYDIIFFWVARMMVMGLEFMDKEPFKHVFIHGLVRDDKGRKMSKSLGNGIDPLDVVEKYGADSLRFTLVTGNTPGNDMRFYWEKAEASRNFANKIWNAARFALMNLHDYDENNNDFEYTLADEWIYARLDETTAEVTRLLEKYEIGEAARLVYDFIWSEFCDWYIELAKPRLYDEQNKIPRQTAQRVLVDVLSCSMKLLHPIMPFITEEIWQALPHKEKSIMIASWPLVQGKQTNCIVKMNIIMEIVKAVRNMRAQMNVAPGKKSDIILQLNQKDIMQLLEENQVYIKNLASAQNVLFIDTQEQKPDNAITAVVDNIQVHLPLRDLIDVDKELERLAKEKQNLDKEIQRIQSKLSNQGFLAKAPADVVDKEKEKCQGYQEKLDIISERIEYFKTI